MDSYNVSTVNDAKRQNIRVGAWVSGWVSGWVAKGKCAIETQGAYKFQNLKLPFWLTSFFFIARKTWLINRYTIVLEGKWPVKYNKFPRIND